jgi:predicted dienelactone hydrolase
MRPLEALLLIVELLAFVAACVRLRGNARWFRHVPYALLPPVAVAQVLVEGPRWQMVPAYVLGGVLVLAWLGRQVRGERPPRRRWLRRLATGVGITSGLLGLAASVTVPIVVPVFTFPTPTGPYGIGTVTYHWVDESRPEIFTSDPDDLREVMVQVWYPAEADDDAPKAAYVPDAGALGPLARLGDLPDFALSHLKYVHTNAIPSAPVADGSGTYPLLVLATGRGGYRQYNTLGVEELVSHGYIVAGIDHPYSSAAVVFPDGRVAPFDNRLMDYAFGDEIIPFIADDAGFTLDRMTAVNRADPKGILTGRVDVQHPGLFGVSLGGEIAGMGCMTDTRFQACLIMDSWLPEEVVEAGLTQPTMWLTRDAATMHQEGWRQTDIDRTLKTMRTVYDRLPTDGYIVRIPGMYHPDFTDIQLISALLRPLGFTGPLDGEKAHRIVNTYTRAFFDGYLKGRPTPLLDRPPEHHTDVLFERHDPPESSPL